MKLTSERTAALRDVRKQPCALGASYPKLSSWTKSHFRNLRFAERKKHTVECVEDLPWSKVCKLVDAVKSECRRNVIFSFEFAIHKIFSLPAVTICYLKAVPCLLNRKLDAFSPPSPCGRGRLSGFDRHFVCSEIDRFFVVTKKINVQSFYRQNVVMPWWNIRPKCLFESVSLRSML